MKKPRTILTKTWQNVLAGFVAAAIGVSSSALAEEYTVDGTGTEPNHYVTLEHLRLAHTDLADGDLILFSGNADARQSLTGAFTATTDLDTDEPQALTLRSELEGNKATITSNGGKFRFLANDDADLFLAAFRSDDADNPAMPSEITISDFKGTDDVKGGALYSGTLILGNRGGGMGTAKIDPSTLTWANNGVAYDGTGDGSAYGGALYVANDFSIYGDTHVFTGNTVTGNTNTSGGGAVAVGGNVNWNGTLYFSDNHVVLQDAASGPMSVGGALFVQNGEASIVSRDAKFIGNTVQGGFEADGGAIAIQGNLTIKGDPMYGDPKIEFVGNEAKCDPESDNDSFTYGGAIYMRQGILTIGDISNPKGTIVFQDNKANSDNSTFERGKASGGAVASENISGRSTIQKVVFTGNDATGCLNADGGAICFNSILTLTDNTFTGNKANTTYAGDLGSEVTAHASGGAIGSTNSLLLTGENIFTGNSANSAMFAEGGAILVQVAQGRDYSTGAPVLNIGGNASFIGNKAETTFAKSSSYGGAIYTAFDTTITGTVFNDNKAVASGTGSSVAACGGAIHALNNLELVGKNQFSGNEAVVANGHAFGGAIHLSRSAIFMVGDMDFVIRGTSATDISTFSGNRAVATADGGRAWGGAIAITDNKSATFIDAQFSGNSAEVLQDGNARGGAVYTNGNLALVAEDQDVRFELNRVKIGDVETPNDIYLAVDDGYGPGGIIPELTLDAVADRQIVLGGGVTGTGTIVVNDHSPVSGSSGFGVVDFAKSGTTDVVGDVRVMGGTLKTAVVADAGACKSNVVLRQTEEEDDEGNLIKTGGRVEIASDVTWTVDTSGVASGRRAAVLVGEAGWTAEHALPGADGRALAQEALDRGNAMYFGLLSANVGADGEATLGVDTSKVHVSDVFVNSLLMHANNAIRNAAGGRIDYNFDRFDGDGNPCNETRRRSKACNIGSSLWGNFVGRSMELDGKTYSSGAGATKEKARFTSSGVQVGADVLATDSVQFGFLIASEEGKNKIGSFDQVESDDYYFGLYGAILFDNGFDLRGMIGGGYQQYDLKRLQVLGTAADRGAFTSRYSGRTFESTVELGRRFHFDGRRLSLRPVLALDVFNNAINGAVEYNGVAQRGLTYGDMSLTQAYFRVGSDVRWTRDRLNLNGGLYYSYDMTSDRTPRTWASRGDEGNVVLGSDLGRSVFGFNIGTNYYMNHARTVNLFVNYFGDFYTDRDGDPTAHTGVAGLQIRF